MEAFEVAREYLEGFTLTDAELVCNVYVCAQCEGDLSFVPCEWDTELIYRWYVICPECGNVEEVGRVTKTTIAIRNERGIFEYPRAIRALPDLWGHLIPTEQDRKVILSQLGY